jgi:hypothetical protein
MGNNEDRELSLSAKLALLQEELHQSRQGEQAPKRIADGCRLAAELRPGDVFLNPGVSAKDESGKAIVVGGCYVTEMHPVTVVRGPEQDLTSDPFGRELIRFRVRSNRFGHEGNLTYGPGGVVRTETGRNFVLYDDLHPKGSR